MAENDGGDWETVPKKKQKSKRNITHSLEQYGCRYQEGTPGGLRSRTDQYPCTGTGTCRLENTGVPSLQVMLVLVGLPGSGKSSWSNRLISAAKRMGKDEDNRHCRYARINQDELGSREVCMEFVVEALQSGYSPVIDRCNISRWQRKNFLDLLSLSTPGAIPPVDCIVFDYDREKCEARCLRRRDHPTLHPSQVKHVLDRMAGEYEPPLEREGFRNVRWICDDASFSSLLSLYLR